MRLRPLRFLLALCIILAPQWFAVSAADSPAPVLVLQEGDHVCLIGNTLAERMQHANHWETLLHQRFPALKLSVRNLGWSADEVVLRPRSQDFGTPHDHLTHSKADVILAFFGFNESFQGPAGVDQFKRDLDGFIRDTLGRQYNGKSAPRLVLVSPIAQQNLHSPDLPDGTANNVNIELYTAAMLEVAGKTGTPFVDLFHPTQSLFTSAKSPLTINGVHLNDSGDAAVARVLDEQLFGASRGSVNFDEKLRAAIADKNFHWFERYRAINGFYIYGGRSRLTFADGPQTNHDVMEREREVLDVMTANRDSRIWAIARGEQSSGPIDDSNVPSFLPVKPFYGVGRNPGAPRGQSSKAAEVENLDYLSTDDAMATFTIAPGYQANLFASEEQFPLLRKPTQCTFDARGRLWVSCMPSYPQWIPGTVMDDYILILEDTDHDGKADQCTKFAGGMHVPTGLELYNGGVLVAGQPDLLYLKDTDGDDVADVRERVLHGFDSADSHHSISAFTLDAAGALYFAEGTFHHSQVETAYGPTRLVNSGAFRYEPKSQKLDVYVTYNFANPWGLAFDHWGQSFLSDASGGANYFATAFSGKLPYPEKHKGMQQWFPMRVRPTAGCEFVASRHFPDEAQGNFLLNNCIGVQGVLQHKVREEGSGYAGQEIEPLLLSSDPNFRPVDLEFAPDGSLFVVDWHNAIIGHMQYSIRDPDRDTKHGRIYRITYPSRPLVNTPDLHAASVAQLIEQLSVPEDRTRTRVKQELVTRPQAKVLAALQAWLAKWDATKQEDQHNRLEVLWAHCYLNVVDEPLLRQLLKSAEPRARAAATRVLCNWRDRVADAPSLLLQQAGDEHPLVRLEAVRAASFVPGQAGVQIAAEILKQPLDSYLEYTLGESLTGLLRTPADVYIPEDAKIASLLLDRVPAQLLNNLDRSEAVATARYMKRDLTTEQRQQQLAELVSVRKSSPAAETVRLLSLLQGRSDQSVEVLTDLGRTLNTLDLGDLSTQRDSLLRLARGSSDTAVATTAWAGLVLIDRDAATTWSAATTGGERRNLLTGLKQVSDPVLRSQFYPQVMGALKTASNGDDRNSLIRALPLMRGFEAESLATLAQAFVLNPGDNAAVESILELPAEAWTSELAAVVATRVLEYAPGVPVDQRTATPFLELTELGQQVARRLPAEQATQIRKTLAELGVPVIVLKTMHEQMRYNQTRLVVQAGKPVEIVFENPDVMPHNLVIVQPGAREEVGLAAAKMQPQADAQGRTYIPQSDKILAATRMLAPGQSTRLGFNAPNQAGEYEYVCTYPGHWMRMYGKLMVVLDVEEFLRTAPPEEIVRVTEWKVQDFSGEFFKLDQNRDFERGRELFVKSACAQCHTFTKDVSFGPSLANVFSRYHNERSLVLETILEPSKKIDDKYRPVAFQLSDGRSISGIIVGQTGDEITVQSGPTPNTIETFRKDHVEETAVLNVSVMPAGLLKTLAKEDVLELLAYILAEGNPKHPIYAHSKSGHDAHKQ